MPSINFNNPDFDDGPAIGSSPGYQNVATPAQAATFMPGWTLVAGEVDILDSSRMQNGSTSQGIDLHGNVPGTIGQTIDTSTVIVGSTITFQISVASTQGTDTMTVTVNGTALIAVGQSSSTFTPTARPNYTTYEYSFASTGSESISIAGGGGIPAGGVYIDSVNITSLCLAAETLLQTPEGKKEIGSLRAGDQVIVADGQAETVRWIKVQHVDAAMIARHPNLRPVRIIAGALGNGLPKRDLVVSQQHRIMVSSKVAERMFGETDVLISALHLTALPGIFIDEDVDSVSYVHLLFDRHEIVFAEGAPAESLFTGPEALKSISTEAKSEIFTLFPELKDPMFVATPVLKCPPTKRQKKLVSRHLANGKAVLETYAE